LQGPRKSQIPYRARSENIKISTPGTPWDSNINWAYELIGVFELNPEKEKWNMKNKLNLFGSKTIGRENHQIRSNPIICIKLKHFITWRPGEWYEENI